MVSLATATTTVLAEDMPVGVSVDALDMRAIIRDPRAVIQRLFDREFSGSANADATYGIPAFFAARFGSENALREIPALLDAHSAGALADGSLVRFRCMVQDNGYAPEVYVPAAPYARDPTKWACLKYLEQPASEEQLAHDIQADTVFADKTVFYAVGVPAESTWVRAAHRQAGGKSASVTTEELSAHLGSTLSLDAVPDAALPMSSKKPIPWENTASAIVKVYENGGSEFRMNEQLDVVGVLEKAEADGGMNVVHAILVRRVTVSDHPKFVGSHLAEDGALFTAEIPSVGTTTAASAHARNEEIFREALAKHAPELASVPIADAFSAIRTALLQWMAESTLVGDELLAEYVLMWLMARIYRRNVDLTLGNLSMTITRCLSVTVDDVPPSSTQRPACSNAFAQSIFELVHALVPKALLLPLSVDMLNKHTLVPKAAQESSPSGDVEDFGGVDYAQGVLDAGLLQLTRGTFLVLDETSLASGQLQQRGIQNLSALRSVLTHHSLDYQLQGQPISFEKELHVMVLSEGESAMSANVRTPAQEPGQAPATVKASLLPTDITVPLAAKSSFDKSRSSSLESSHPWLPLFRLYVSYFRGAGSPSNDYTIPDAMAKLIEREFSEQRKAASADPAMRLMSDVDLLQLLGLARLLALSMGRSLLDEEVWERVKTLEKERELRINSPPATSQPGH